LRLIIEAELISVYILAIPVFSFFLPLYSFWKMDDFSWGSTRLGKLASWYMMHTADVQLLEIRVKS